MIKNPVMLTETQEDYDALVGELESQGLKRRGGISPLRINSWWVFRSNTCVYLDKEDTIVVGTLLSFKHDKQKPVIVTYKSKENNMKTNKQETPTKPVEGVSSPTDNTNQTIFNTVSALTKPIELPYFVCSWLRFGKRMNLDLVEVLTPQKLNGTKTATYVAEWLYKDSDNQNKLARAFMGGFSEDNTPYYRVELPHARDSKAYLWVDPIHGIHNHTTARVSGSVSIFTKAEIERLDSRYWLFAEPLEVVNDLEEL